MQLEMISSPADLRTLHVKQLPEVAEQVRQLIIETTAKNGGHLASNLGSVELAIALHYVFDTPKDKLIWDVGHQSYAHKILTGRRDEFATLRQEGGISGFNCRKESEYDVFTTGHSSDSVSLALGMALARDLAGDAYHVAAVLGDGALTGGMAWEAINHAGDLEHPLIVVLNDNEMCIGGNVGALATHLSRMRSNPKYTRLKYKVKHGLEKVPLLGKLLIKLITGIKRMLKSALVSGQVFENLGFVYLGPIDGHDIPVMIDLLRHAKTSDKPVLLHVRTKKGKGYAPAETDPERWHNTEPFDIASGKQLQNAAATYTDVFGKTMLQLGKEDANIVAVTAAMVHGTGLRSFEQAYPKRCIDAGIAEQHAAGLAAGLAEQGKKPVFAVYSTFVQRAYDQIVEDICLQDLPVVLAIDRAGLVRDGLSHQGALDIALLRSIPNMTLLAPASEPELQAMLHFALQFGHPAAIRYPRCTAWAGEGELPIIEYGKGVVVREGSDIAIIALGSMVEIGCEVADLLQEKGISARLVNARFAAPVDARLICQSAELCQNRVITLEEGVRSGGFGEACAALLPANAQVEIAALPDEFVPHGGRPALLQHCGLDALSIANRIEMQWFSSN